MRKQPFTNGEYYHVYNRGTEKRIIFLDDADRNRFIQNIIAANHSTSDEHRIDIICFCLMPNHYHLIVRQHSDNGISKFMASLGNGYTKYFNTKYERFGRLFESKFKDRHIHADDYLLNLSAYIHNNPMELTEINGDWNKLYEYPWSSLRHYLNQEILGFIHEKPIMDHFSDENDYRAYVKNQYETFQRKRLAT